MTNSTVLELLLPTCLAFSCQEVEKAEAIMPSAVFTLIILCLSFAFLVRCMLTFLLFSTGLVIRVENFSSIRYQRMKGNRKIYYRITRLKKKSLEFQSH